MGGLGRVVGLAAPFMTMPWLVGYLGDRGFGLWITATGLTTMSAFLDFGLGNALLTRLASAFGRDDLEEAREAISSAYAALGLVALALLMIGLTAALIGSPVLQVLHISPAEGDLAIISTTLFGFVIGIPLSIIYRIYYAKQQVAYSSFWQVLGAGLSVLVTFLTIHAGARAWEVTLAYALAPVATMGLASLWFFSRNPALRPTPVLASVAAMRSLLSLGLRFLTLSVLTSFLLNLDPLVIAWKAGPEAVANFAVPSKLGSLLMLVVTTLFLPLWAANGDAIARKDFVWLHKSTRRMSMYGSLFVAGLGLGLIAASDWLIWLWMGRAFDQQTAILSAVAFFAVVMAFTSPYNMTLNALGKVRLQIFAWMAFGLVVVPAKLLLVTDIALWWAPLTSALAYMLTVMPLVVCFRSTRL